VTGLRSPTPRSGGRRARDASAILPERPVVRTKKKAARAPMRRGEIVSVSRHGFHRIAFTDWGNEKPEQGVVLCVHGLTRQGRDFDPLAADLAARGFRVICPDLPGRGQSEWLTQSDDYELPQFVMDMTVLIARLDVRSVDWVGTSLGGLIGIVVAGQSGSPIRRLVVNAIGPELPWPALRRIGDYLERQPQHFANMAAAEAYFRNVLSEFGALSDETWQHLTRHSVEELQPGGICRLLCDPGIAKAFRPLRAYSLNLWMYWDAVAVPALLLRGASSDLLPRSVATAMTRRGPRPELVEFPNCGHAPLLFDAEQINTVADWLSQRSTRR
jgi:pimeloyl-ACP methyl ester carboxylesterase